MFKGVIYMKFFPRHEKYKIVTVRLNLLLDKTILIYMFIYLIVIFIHVIFFNLLIELLI